MNIDGSRRPMRIFLTRKKKKKDEVTLRVSFADFHLLKKMLYAGQNVPTSESGGLEFDTSGVDDWEALFPELQLSPEMKKMVEAGKKKKKVKAIGSKKRFRGFD